MTPKTLFVIILKVFGLFFIRDLLTVVPQLFSLSAFIDINAPVSQYIGPLITLLVLLAIYILIIYILLFKTGFVVEKFRLHKGFEQDSLDINIDHSVVLRVVLFVLAGLILINELPNFIRLITIYFGQINFIRGSHPEMFNIIISLSKIIVALLLMGYQRQLANFISSKNK